MPRRTLLATALAAGALLAPAGAQAASPDVVISEVYGGGGNAGATLKNDFIELYNRGSVPVAVDSWTVQYASSSGSSWDSTVLAGSIASNAYYLVQEGAGAGGTVSLPTPNATGGIAMSATAGKVALSSNSTILSGTCPGGLVDFVGYGSSTNCWETSPAPTLSNTTADLRHCRPTGRARRLVQRDRERAARLRRSGGRPRRARSLARLR